MRIFTAAKPFSLESHCRENTPALTFPVAQLCPSLTLGFFIFTFVSTFQRRGLFLSERASGPFSSLWTPYLSMVLRTAPGAFYVVTVSSNQIMLGPLPFYLVHSLPVFHSLSLTYSWHSSLCVSPFFLLINIYLSVCFLFILISLHLLYHCAPGPSSVQGEAKLLSTAQEVLRVRSFTGLWVPASPLDLTLLCPMWTFSVSILYNASYLLLLYFLIVFVTCECSFYSNFVFTFSPS